MPSPGGVGPPLRRLPLAQPMAVRDQGGHARRAADGRLRAARSWRWSRPSDDSYRVGRGAVEPGAVALRHRWSTAAPRSAPGSTSRRTPVRGTRTHRCLTPLFQRLRSTALRTAARSGVGFHVIAEARPALARRRRHAPRLLPGQLQSAAEPTTRSSVGSTSSGPAPRAITAAHLGVALGGQEQRQVTVPSSRSVPSGLPVVSGSPSQSSMSSAIWKARPSASAKRAQQLAGPRRPARPGGRRASPRRRTGGRS